WEVIGRRLGTNITTQGLSLTVPSTNPIIQSGSFVQFAYNADSTNDILKLIEGFGTNRTLSSPRLHAINNQLSTLTFTKNLVYFNITVTPGTVTPGTSGGAPTITPTVFSSSQQVSPIGIIMTLMPSIDSKNNEVTLSVRPTLTTKVADAIDPAFDLEILTAIATGTIPSNAVDKALLLHNVYPVIQVRELDSTLKLKSGQTMIIGGLMQQEASDTDTGLPFGSGIPVIGNLFKSVTKSMHNKELVLLIKATVVNSRGSMNNVDKNIFNKFSDDPRPVSF
ncbi:MAG: hypothetical protein WCJ33_02250, partial [Pseudomonadota bacterium]